MISIYDMKPKFQALLRPAVAGLARLGVTANQVTIAAMALSVAFGAALWASGGASALFLLLPVILLLRMALNAIDGMLARDHGQASKPGAFLNEVGDVVSDTALILPLALTPPFALWGVLAIAALAVLTEFVGVMGPGIGASRRYDGPMGKSDRAATLGALGVWIGFGAPLPVLGVPITIALLGLLALTTFNRVRSAIFETVEA